MKHITLIVAVGITMFGCAHNKEAEHVDNKITQETAVPTPRELQEKTDELVANTSLTNEQRQRLRVLRSSARARVADLRAESRKLRALLIQQVMDPGVKSTEIDAIKKKIRANEEQRLAVLFNSIDRTNEILGRENRDKKMLETREIFLNRIFEPDIEIR